MISMILATACVTIPTIECPSYPTMSDALWMRLQPMIDHKSKYFDYEMRVWMDQQSRLHDKLQAGCR